jgi:uncharacterized protein YkwD
MKMKFNHIDRLFFIMLSLATLCSFNGQAVARETYVAFAARMVAQAQSENDVRADLEVEILQLANAYRKSKGLNGLTADPAMVAAARAHAMDMMLGKFMGHVASIGHNFESRMRALRPGAMVLPMMAENAARVSKAGEVNSAMAASLFQQWVKSAPHRHTLLSRDYVKVATGAVSRGGVLYADMIFSGPEVKTNMQQGTAVPGLY